MTRLGMVLALVAALAFAVPGIGYPTPTHVEIRVLSTRADLVSGDDALVEVVLPAKTDPSKVTVAVDGRDVTSAFAIRQDGRFFGEKVHDGKGYRATDDHVGVRGSCAADRGQRSTTCLDSDVQAQIRNGLVEHMDRLGL